MTRVVVGYLLAGIALAVPGFLIFLYSLRIDPKHRLAGLVNHSHLSMLVLGVPFAMVCTVLLVTHRISGRR